jgi:superfamily II DNA or RNA helicase
MRVSKYVVNANIRLGLSATYKREDGKQMDIESCVGQPVFKIEATEMINKGHIMKPEIIFYNYLTTPGIKHDKYADAYNDKIMNGVARNNLIFAIIKKFAGYNVLIIVNKIEHGMFLNQSIKNSVFIHGDVKQEERERWLTDMKNNRGKIIIGTASIIGKGLDLPSLDVMINATGNLSAITTIQSLGRVLRNHDEKTKAYYIDFFDRGDYFREHTNKRMQTLKDEGHEIKVIDAVLK